VRLGERVQQLLPQIMTRHTSTLPASRLFSLFKLFSGLDYAPIHPCLTPHPPKADTLNPPTPPPRPPQVPPTVDNLLENVMSCVASTLGLPPDALSNPHRLDVGTSGVVLLAKTQGFARWFSNALKLKPAVVVKTYRCLSAAAPPLGPLVHWAVVKQRQAGEPAHTRMLLECAVPDAAQSDAAAAAAAAAAGGRGDGGPVRCELIVEQVRGVLGGGIVGVWECVDRDRLLSSITLPSVVSDGIIIHAQECLLATPYVASVGVVSKATSQAGTVWVITEWCNQGVEQRQQGLVLRVDFASRVCHAGHRKPSTVMQSAVSTSPGCQLWARLCTTKEGKPHTPSYSLPLYIQRHQRLCMDCLHKVDITTQGLSTLWMAVCVSGGVCRVFRCVVWS